MLSTASEGAGEHCEAGGREVFFQKMFGWLDPIWLDETSNECLNSTFLKTDQWAVTLSG